ncbi:MAG: IS110 family transposase [Ferroplasma sp.]|uniref:IS110 family transposase n=1 Tax=Ferroplasma sp. TaxID=2591003 RepID=UPI00281679AB|nr:IS110 family transposase [Ferroplasma sp.]WMT51062.1 MAG: IS110 family transposase [Ferroplasma sp.]
MIYIGIDIAKRKFDYCIIDSDLNRIRSGIISNNSNGFNEMLNIIGNYGNARIGMESTNIYHLNLYSFLIGHNFNPLLLNSIETKIIKKSRIRKNKTDKIDSEAIARYPIISGNNTVNMFNYPELKEYANTYFRINKKITAVKNALIRDLDLLYPGMPSIIDINAKYLNEIISNIDNIKNGNYKIKYIDTGKNAILSISGNNSNAVKI